MTRRDLPALCLLMAACAALATVASLVVRWVESPPPYRDLAPVSGRVIDSFLRKNGRGASQVHLLIQAADGVRECAQHASHLTQGLLDLPKGTEVSALVRLGSIARPVDQLWELRSGSTALLTYENLAGRAIRTDQRASRVDGACAWVAACFLVVALILRRQFGAWRERPPEAARK